MVSLQNPKSILASSVLDKDCVAILPNVAVLTNPLTISCHFLPGDGPIFLGIGRAKSPISSIESLLLQNLGAFTVLELSSDSQYQARGCKHNSEHLSSVCVSLHL